MNRDSYSFPGKYEKTLFKNAIINNVLCFSACRVGEPNITDKTSQARRAGLRYTCTVPFSGWIKFLPRWAHPITQFLLCLKGFWASALWKLIEPCMYLKDVWVRHMYKTGSSLYYTWLLWPTVRSGKKNKDANKLLVSRFFLVYIVIFSCKSLYRAVCNTVVRDDQVSIIWTLKQSYLAHWDSHMLNMHCFVYSGVNTKGGWRLLQFSTVLFLIIVAVL